MNGESSAQSSRPQILCKLCSPQKARGEAQFPFEPRPLPLAHISPDNLRVILAAKRCASAVCAPAPSRRLARSLLSVQLRSPPFCVVSLIAKGSIAYRVAQELLPVPIAEREKTPRCAPTVIGLANTASYPLIPVWFRRIQRGSQRGSCVARDSANMSRKLGFLLRSCFFPPSRIVDYRCNRLSLYNFGFHCEISFTLVRFPRRKPGSGRCTGNTSHPPTQPYNRRSNKRYETSLRRTL